MGGRPVTFGSLVLQTLARASPATELAAGRYEAVDLMGSDPLLTVAEAKNRGVFASIPVMKGSDPIKSTLR